MKLWRILCEKHPLLPYLAIIGVVAVMAGIALIIYINSRTTIDQGSIDTATNHCQAWVQKYTSETNPVEVCKNALDKNLKAFTYRWSKGIGPT